MTKSVKRVYSVVALALVCLLGSLSANVNAQQAADPSNLLRNGNFELGVYGDGIPLHWSLYGPNSEAFSIVTDEKAIEGTYSVKVVDPSPTYATGVSSERYPANPGELYRAEVDVYIETGNFFIIYLEFHDDTRRIGYFTDNTTSSGKPGEWVTLVTEGVAPEGTTKVSVLLYSGGGHVGIAYFDNARLYKID